MKDTELRVLAAVLPDRSGRMEKAQLRLISSRNFSTPILRELWRLMDAYYDDHMAVIPLWYLKDKSPQLGYEGSKIAALVELYNFLSQTEVSEHEFEAALEILKTEELTHKTAEVLVSAREILQGEYYDDKEEVSLSGQEDARAYLASALQELESSGTEGAPEGDMRADMDKLWQAYIRREEEPESEAGIPYGISELDEITGGTRPGDLTLVAAFTSSGKSQFISHLAWSGICAGKHVLMFTTETTREEMEVRIIARHSRLAKFKLPGGLDSHDIFSGTLTPQHKQVFREVLEDFKQLNGRLTMVQMPTSGSEEYVYAKSNQYNRHTPVDLILIDSINLLRGSGRTDSKREMLENLLQNFKRFASAFDNGRGVAIVSPWQMSRTAWREALESGGVYTLASLSDTSEAEKSPSSIITLFKGDEIGEPGRVYIQLLKSRGSKEMGRISYPIDYRNSYFGSSGDASPSDSPKSPGSRRDSVVQDISTMMGEF